MHKLWSGCGKGVFIVGVLCTGGFGVCVWGVKTGLLRTVYRVFILAFSHNQKTLNPLLNKFIHAFHNPYYINN